LPPTTAARRPRSSKRSGASCLPKPPPDPNVTFFVDESLGSRKVPDALRALGCKVEWHGDHFAAGTPDVEWLGEVSRRGWVILTKDRHIRTRQTELAQIIAAGGVAFVLATAGTTGDENAAAFVTAYRRMVNMVRSTPRPFLARVSASGVVTLVATARRARDRG
jgi:hypothetical protein